MQTATERTDAGEVIVVFLFSGRSKRNCSLNLGAQQNWSASHYTIHFTNHGVVSWVVLCVCFAQVVSLSETVVAPGGGRNRGADHALQGGRSGS